MNELVQQVEVPINMNKLQATEYVLYRNDCLINGEVVIDENDTSETVVIRYDVKDLLPISEAQKLTLEEKYNLLSNVAKLRVLCNKYVFDLSPDNIFFNNNLDVRLLERNIGITTEEDFLKKYKALAGTLINKKYAYNDYYAGGDDLFSKNKKTSPISQFDNIDALRDYFTEKQIAEKAYHKDNFVEISRSSYKSKRVLFPVLIVFFVVSAIISGYLTLFELPLKNKLIEANSYYLKNDYINVEKSLEAVSLSRIPYESKYILAVSYLKTVDLSQEEKANEMLQMTTNTQEILFDYWIHIGRMEYESAVDDAQRLNSNSHLFYAYVCYRKSVENDLTIDGSEKTNLLSSIENEIERLRKILTVDENVESVVEAEPTAVTETETESETVSQTTAETTAIMTQIEEVIEETTIVDVDNGEGVVEE